MLTFNSEISDPSIRIYPSLGGEAWLRADLEAVSHDAGMENSKVS